MRRCQLQGGYIKLKMYFNTGLSIETDRLFHPVELLKGMTDDFLHAPGTGHEMENIDPRRKKLINL